MRLIAAVIAIALTAATSASARAVCNKHTPCPVISFSPAAPSITDDTPVGTIIANITVTMKPNGIFAGSLSFGAPYGNAGGLLGISGSDIVLVAPLPAGASQQHATVVATQ
jgi:hypothetical protein